MRVNTRYINSTRGTSSYIKHLVSASKYSHMCEVRGCVNACSLLIKLLLFLRVVKVDSVPAHPQLVTSQVPLLDRVHVGSPNTVYLGDSNYSYVPADGVISEWQFFVRSSGSAAFQVWRSRSDLGVRK